jgi:hypothetical protein
MARDLQAPEGNGAFISDERVVYAEIAQLALIEMFKPLPVVPAAAPGSDRRLAAPQLAPEKGAKRSDAAAALRARREDGMSQGDASELSRRSWRPRRMRAITGW